jgi:hypothetical protein
MATLGELYSSLDILNSLGKDTTEIEVQVRNKEQEVLEKEIIPSVQEIVDVLCSQLRTDVKFSISHRVGKPALIETSIVQKDNCHAQSCATIFSPSKTLHKFYVKNQKGAIGIGVYNSESNTFRLLSGSKIIGSPLNSFNRKDIYKDVTENHCSFIDGLYILEKDYIFASPSTASSVVLGRSSNGWKDWKDDFGKCLSDIYRKK